VGAPRLVAAGPSPPAWAFPTRWQGHPWTRTCKTHRPKPERPSRGRERRLGDTRMCAQLPGQVPDHPERGGRRRRRGHVRRLPEEMCVRARRGHWWAGVPRRADHGHLPGVLGCVRPWRRRALAGAQGSSRSCTPHYLDKRAGGSLLLQRHRANASPLGGAPAMARRAGYDTEGRRCRDTGGLHAPMRQPCLQPREHAG
jgi:hypothetical protein